MITLEELLAELEAAREASRVHGHSMAEIADLWGVSMDVARKRVKQAVKAGLMRCVGRAQRPTISGTTTGVPIYRFSSEGVAPA